VFLSSTKGLGQTVEKGPSKQMTGRRKEIGQKDTREYLINDNAKGGNPCVNLVMERG